MSDKKEILAGVLIKPEAGRVKIELVNLDSRGQSFEVSMSTADAWKFCLGLTKATVSAEAQEENRNEEVRSTVRDALKKLGNKAWEE